MVLTLLDIASNVFGPKTESNVKIVGDIIDNNHVLSNFKTTNRAFIRKIFNPGNKAWKQVWCFTTGEDITTNQQVISRMYECWCQKITINENKLYFPLGSRELMSAFNEWDINDYSVFFNIQPNTEYYFSLEYDTTKYIAKLANNKLFSNAEIITVNNSTPISCISGGITLGSSSNLLGLNNDAYICFKGSFDLSECYIIIDNDLWWKGVDYVSELNKLYDSYNCYSSGECIRIANYMQSGYISNGSKEFGFNFITDKSLENISNITLLRFNGWIRYNDIYSQGYDSNGNNYLYLMNPSVNIVINRPNLISVKLLSTKKWFDSNNIIAGFQGEILLQLD